jgi:hypothetical protein
MYFSLAEFWPKPAENPVLSLKHYSVEKGKLPVFVFELVAQEFGNPGRGSQLEAAGGTGQGDQLCRVPHQTALVIKAPITVLYTLNSGTVYTHPAFYGINYSSLKFEPVFIII